MFETRLSLRQQGIRQRSLRKHCRLGRATELVFVLATGVTMVLSGTSAEAQVDLQYDAGTDAGAGVVTGGPGFFSNSSGEFNDGTTDGVVPTAVDNVFFGGNAVGLNNDTVGNYGVTVGDNVANGATVTVNNLTIVNTGIALNSNGDDSLDVNGLLLVASGATASLTAPLTDTLTIGDGTGAFNGNLSISGGTGGAVTQNTQSGTVTINGGSYGGTWQTQTGATIINGASTISGNLDLDSGTAQVNANLDLNSGAGTMDVASGVGIASIANGIELDGNISAANGTAGATSGLTIGASTIDGNLTVTGGQTEISGGTTTVQGVVVVSGGELQVTNTLTVADTIGGGGNTDVTVASGATLDVNGTVNADTVSVSGFLDLAGNIQGQATIISGADVDIDGDSTISGGTTIQGGASFDVDNAFTGNINSFGNTSIAGDVTGIVTVSGDTVTVDGDSTVSGGINVSGLGTLSVTDNLNAGISSGGNVDVDLDTGETLTGSITANNGNVTIDGNVQGALNITGLGGPVTGTIDGNSTLSGGANVAGNSTLNVDASVVGNINSSGTLDVSLATNETISGQIQVLDGDASITGNITSSLTVATTQTDGSDVVLIDGASTIGGGVVIGSNGTLDVDAALTGDVNMTAIGRTLDVDDTITGNVTVAAGEATISSNITGTYLQSGGNTTIDNDATIGGAITIDEGSFVVSSGDTLTASGGVNVGNNAGGTDTFAIEGDYVGALTVDAGGVVNLSNGFNTDNGAFNVNGGTVTNANNGAHTITMGTGAFTGNGTIDAGTGSVVINAGTVSLTAAFSDLGTDVTINANLLEIGNSQTISANQASDIVVVSGGVLTIDTATPGTVTLGLDQVAPDPEVTDIVINSGGTLNIAANDTLSAKALQNDGDMSIGAGAQFFGTGNTYDNNGNVTIADGGSIIDNEAINNNATGAITIEGNATIDADADNDNGVGETITNAGTIVVQNTGGSTVAIGADALGNNDITQSGTGAITIEAGATVNNIGTFTNTSTGGLGTAIVVENGSLLDADSLTSNNGTIDVNSGEIDANTTIEGAGNLTLAGTLDGTLALQDGNMTIDGASTITGNVTIGDDDGNAATLTQDATGALDITGASITVDDDGVLDINADVTGTAGSTVITMSGDGGTGQTTIANSSVTGNIDVQDGNITFDTGASTVRGDIVVGDSDAVAANMTIDAAAPLTLGSVADNITVNSDGTLNIEGNINGTGSAGAVDLVVDGGAVTLNGAEITGDVQIDEGTFAVQTGASTIDGVVTVGNGTDTASFTSDIALTLETNNDSIIANANSTVDINADLTGNEGNEVLDVVGGTVSIGGGAASTVIGSIGIDSGNVTIDGSDTVSFDDDITVGDDLAGDAALTVNNQIAFLDTADNIVVNDDGDLDVSADVTGAADTINVIDIQGGDATIGTSSIVGNVALDDGTLNIDDTVSMDGDINIGDGDTVVSSNATIAGAVTFVDADGNILVRRDGDATISANVTGANDTVDVIVVNRGELDIGTSAVVGNIDLQDGDLVVSDTLSVDGDIRIGDNDGTAAINQGNTTISADVAFNGAGDQIIIEEDGNLVVNGAATIAAAAETDTVILMNNGDATIGSGATIAGATDIQGGNVTVGAGGATFDGDILVGDGTSPVDALLDVDNTLTLGDSADQIVIASDGTVDIDANVIAQAVGDDAIDLNGGNASIGAASITGAIDITDGTLNIDGNATVNGVITVDDAAGNATLDVNDDQTLRVAQSIVVEDSGVLDLNGDLRAVDAAGVADATLTAVTINNGGQASIGTAGDTVLLAGDFDITEGTATIEGDTNLDSDMDLGDGTGAADVELVIATGQTLTVNNSTNLILVEDDAILDLDGTLTGLDGSTVVQLQGDANTARFEIAGGVVTGDIDIDDGLASLEGATTLDGQMFIGDGDAVTAEFDITDGNALTILDSDNYIVVQNEGVLDIDENISGTDKIIDVENGGTVSISAAVVTGDIEIDEGTVTIDGTSTLDGTIAIDDNLGGGGELDILAGQTLVLAGGDDSILVGANGTLDVNGLLDGTDGSLAVRLEGPLDGARLEIAGGTLEGDIEVLDGLASIEGNTTIDGSVTIGDDDAVSAEFDVTGADLTILDADNQITVTDEGVLDLNDDLTGTDTVVVVEDEGTVSIAGAVVTGDIDVNEGDITIDGASTITGDVALGDGTVDAATSEMEVDAALVLTGTSSITVEDDGLLDIDDTVSGTNDTLAILLTGDANTAELQVDAQVSGDINIEEGVATIGGGGSGVLIDGSIIVGDDDATSATDDTVSADLQIAAATTIASGDNITVNDDGALDIAALLDGTDNETIVTLQGDENTAELDIGADVNGDIDVDDGMVTVTAASSVDGTITLGDNDTVTSTMTVDQALTMNTGGDDSIVVNDDGILDLNNNLIGTTGAPVLLVQGTAGTADVNVGNSTITGDASVEAGDMTIDGAAEFDDDLTIGDGAGAMANLMVNNGFTLDLDDTFNLGSDARVTIGSGSTIDHADQTSAAVFGAGSETVLDSNASFIGSPNILGLINAQAGGGSINGDTSAGATTIGSSAVIDVANGTAGDNTFTISDTDGVVFSGGTVQLDANLSDGSAVFDSLTINGTASGTVNIALNDLTGGNIYGALPTDGVVLLDLDAGSTLTPSGATPVDPNGSVTYSYGVDANGDVVLLSAGAAASVGLTGAVAAAQSLIAATINRPTSPFVTGLSREARGFVEDAIVSSQGAFQRDVAPGAWVRISGGNATGQTTAVGRNTVESETFSTYYGLQLGADITNFGSDFEGGWDMTLGATLGYNTASTEQPIENEALGTTGSITTLDLNQTYAGLYLVGVRGRFSFDVQARYERTDYTINSETKAGPALNVDDTKYSTDAFTLSAAGSYTFSVPNSPNLFFVPTAGLSITRTNEADVELTNGDVIKFDETTTRVAFAGATLAYANFNETTGAQTAVFGTLTHYNNFSEDPTSVVEFASGTTESVSASTLPDYSELSLGYVYNRETGSSTLGTLRKLSASIRADARMGEEFESYGLTAQVRFQF